MTQISRRAAITALGAAAFGVSRSASGETQGQTAGEKPGQTAGQAGREAAGQPPAPAAVVHVGLAYPRGQYFFDPVGVWVPAGGAVRWEFGFTGGVGALMGVSITAFHPANENHELRIPPAAKPFDSGPMNRAANGFIRFDHTFEVEGTYDYFSLTHESIGMVGRVVVGRPGGPGDQPPGYGAREGRAPMYPASATILNACPSRRIVEEKKIPYPRDLVVRPYPYGETR